MLSLELLKKLEGLHTIETAAKTLNVKEGTMRNILTKLKKEGYATGKGKKPRLYRITTTKQRKRGIGMYTLINKYSKMKLAEPYIHEVHGKYEAEDAIIDAIQTGSFRVILASLRLFNHVTDWKKLYREAKRKSIWNKVGALYDLARMHVKTRRIPKKYWKPIKTGKEYLIRDYKTKEENYLWIRDKWNVEIPFRKGDMEKALYDNT
jgi:hypothetical protein